MKQKQKDYPMHPDVLGLTNEFILLKESFSLNSIQNCLVKMMNLKEKVKARHKKSAELHVHDKIDLLYLYRVCGEEIIRQETLLKYR